MATSNMTAISSASGMLQYCLEKKGAGADRVKAVFSTLLSNEKDIPGMEKELQSMAGQKYQAIHFRVSFDPVDRRLSDREMDQFIDDLCKEYLGERQYIAVRHGDTAIDHVHIVASFLDRQGHCLSFSGRAKYAEAIKQFECVERACKRHGLSSIKRTHTTYHTSKDGQTITEKKRAEKHLYIWKDDLRARLDLIRAQSPDITTYIKECQAQGIEARLRGATLSYKFTDSDGKQRICRGHKLGTEYTLTGVQQSVRPAVDKADTKWLPHTAPAPKQPDPTALALNKMVDALAKLPGGGTGHGGGHHSSSGGSKADETADEMKARHLRESQAWACNQPDEPKK